MEILLWIGFAQSVFSATLFFFVKKEKSLSNRILSAWLIIIALEFVTTAIDISRGSNHLTNPFLIFNPLIYFYSRSLIFPGTRFKWWELWHFLPYLYIKVGAYLSGVQMAYNDFFVLDHDTWFKMSMGFISVLSFFGYSIASLIMVHRHRMSLKNRFSTIDSRITLGWLLFVIIFYMSFLVLAYLLGLIDVLTRIATHAQTVTYAFTLGLVYVFSFYGLLQDQIYSWDLIEKPEKYKNPRLTGDAIQQSIQELEMFFQREKPYLDSSLTINMVSDRLGLSRHALTEVLNSGLKKNF